MFFDKIFSINNNCLGRTVIYIFGIRIRFLNKKTAEIRKNFTNYYKSFSDIENIPPATGDLRLIQEANIKFLKEFDKACREHNINYWLDFGTLLGAIRHKGYIPWDDDIDLGMMREDYEKVISLFEQKKFDEKFKLFYSFNNRNKCFVKIKLSGSENVFIDIFPYDYYHSKLSYDEKFELSKKIEKIVNRKSEFYISMEKIRKFFKDKTESFILNNKKVNKEIKPAIFMGIDYPHKWENKVYDYEQIFPLKKIEFEKEEFLAPNMPEEVLKSIFENYMELPEDCYPRHSNYMNMGENEKFLLKYFVGK